MMIFYALLAWLLVGVRILIATDCGNGFCNEAQFQDCIECTPGTHGMGNTDCPNGDWVCASCESGTSSTLNYAWACTGPSTTSCPAGSGISYGNEGCYTCGAGSYSDGSGKYCTECPPGNYSSNAGSTSCTPCPAGKYQSGYESTSCIDCSAGYYSSSEGSTTCSQCPAGQYSSANAQSCTVCPAGQYNTNNGSDTCFQCPAGSFSATTGSTSCTQCPAGSYQSHSGQSSCVTCPAGSYCPTGATTATQCAADTYSASSAAACSHCPNGETSSAGATSCTESSAAKAAATVMWAGVSLCLLIVVVGGCVALAWYPEQGFFRTWCETPAWDPHSSESGPVVKSVGDTMKVDNPLHNSAPIIGSSSAGIETSSNTISTNDEECGHPRTANEPNPAQSDTVQLPAPVQVISTQPPSAEDTPTVTTKPAMQYFDVRRAQSVDSSYAPVVGGRRRPILSVPYAPEVNSQVYGLAQLSLQLFSLCSFVVSLAVDYEDTTWQRNVVSGMTAYVIVSWVVVPIWQNYSIVSADNQLVYCEDSQQGCCYFCGVKRGCIYCTVYSICCNMVCCCGLRMHFVPRLDRDCRRMPFSLYNLLFMVMNPGKQLNEQLPPNLPEFGLGRAYLLLLSVNTRGTLNLYIAINALVKLVQAATSPFSISTFFAIISFASSLLELRIYVLSVFYGVLLIPFSLVLSCMFCCVDCCGWTETIQAKQGTKEYDRLLRLWDKVSKY